MGTLKDVLVKVTVFTKIEEALVLKQYMTDSVSKGSTSVLYKNPAITTAFYSAGTTASKTIQIAVDNYKAAPITTNESAIIDAMDAGKVWLKKYAVLVQPIANDDANRNTRQEAATNIEASFLTPQKLKSTKIGDPEIPVLVVENKGKAQIYIKLTNGATYRPTNTIFIAVQLPTYTTAETPDPLVTLDGVTGQIKVVSIGDCETITLTVTGKGKFATLNATSTGSRYAVYAYAQNGKKQLSELSTVIVVKL